MSAASTIDIPLVPDQFQMRERVLARYGSLIASGFRFDNGVCAVRLQNESGNLLLLPFQGQQIWSAEFNGRELSMRSMFDGPRPTQDYLATYGGFLLHCGATAMGVPGEADTHPLHGELPNAPYQKANLRIGEDEHGPYLALGGRYQHTIAFSYNYVAEPLVRLYAGSTCFHVSFTLTNLKRSEMEYMYMAHINFRPVDNGQLIYSALQTPAHVRVRHSIPSHVRPQPGYRALLERLRLHPEEHHNLDPGLAFDPEVVFMIDYRADDKGWAHSLQRHPDGSADYVAHRPDQLDHVVRWISRTADHDAIGFAMPATAEPEGYHAEREKGNIRVLPPGDRFHCDLRIGVLSVEACKQVAATIEKIVEQP